jgi:hypothetical protein
MAERPTILLIGPMPPPPHGLSVAMHAVLTSSVATIFRSDVFYMIVVSGSLPTQTGGSSA